MVGKYPNVCATLKDKRQGLLKREHTMEKGSIKGSKKTKIPLRNPSKPSLNLA